MDRIKENNIPSIEWSIKFERFGHSWIQFGYERSRWGAHDHDCQCQNKEKEQTPKPEVKSND